MVVMNREATTATRTPFGTLARPRGDVCAHAVIYAYPHPKLCPGLLPIFSSCGLRWSHGWRTRCGALLRGDLSWRATRWPGGRGVPYFYGMSLNDLVIFAGMRLRHRIGRCRLGTLSVEAARAIVAALAGARCVWVRVCGEHSSWASLGFLLAAFATITFITSSGSILFRWHFCRWDWPEVFTQHFLGIRCSALLPHHLRIRLARVNGRVHA